MAVGVSIDDSDVQALIKEFGPGKTGVMLQRAISRTVTTGRALIARRIGQEVKLSSKAIKDTITVKRGSFADPSGSITVSKEKTIWLSQFTSAKRARVAPRGGITVSVRRKATPKHPTTEKFPHAFWAVTPNSSNIGIFQRTGLKRVMKSGRYKGRTREVIRRMRGPSPLGVFLHAKGEQTQTVFADVVQDLGLVLQKNVESQIDFALGGKTSARTESLIGLSEAANA